MISFLLGKSLELGLLDNMIMFMFIFKNAKL